MKASVDYIKNLQSEAQRAKELEDKLRNMTLLNRKLFNRMKDLEMQCKINEIISSTNANGPQHVQLQTSNSNGLILNRQHQQHKQPKNIKQEPFDIDLNTVSNASDIIVQSQQTQQQQQQQQMMFNFQNSIFNDSGLCLSDIQFDDLLSSPMKQNDPFLNNGTYDDTNLMDSIN